jgi:thiamine-phosphate pyrophosphorylase
MQTTPVDSLALRSNYNLKRPISCLITEGKLTDETYDEAIAGLLAVLKSAIEEGVSLIQLREKNLSARRLEHLAAELANLRADSETRLLVNDRADVAVATGCDGVHLSGRSMRPEVVRAAFGSGLLIGASVHSAKEAETAVSSGAVDFVQFGPIFASPGKGEGVGLEKLAEACRVAGDVPVVAVGGIDESNVADVLAAGAAGFAAIRAMNNAAERAAMLSKL